LIIGSYFVLFLPSEQSHLSCSRAAVKVFILKGGAYSAVADNSARGAYYFCSKEM